MFKSIFLLTVSLLSFSAQADIFLRQGDSVRLAGNQVFCGGSDTPPAPAAPVVQHMSCFCAVWDTSYGTKWRFELTKTITMSSGESRTETLYKAYNYIDTKQEAEEACQRMKEDSCR